MREDSKHPSRRVGIIISEAVHAVGKEAAKREQRSFSNYVAWLIDQATKRNEAPRNEEATKAA